MLLKVSALAFSLQSLASALTLVTGILLPRLLPDGDLGRYLLFTSLQTIGVLGALIGIRHPVERSYGNLWRQSPDRAGEFLAVMGAARGAITAASTAFVVALAVALPGTGFSATVLLSLGAVVMLRGAADLFLHVLLSCRRDWPALGAPALRTGLRPPAVLAGYAVAGMDGVALAVLVIEGAVLAGAFTCARPWLRWRWGRGAWGRQRGELRFGGGVAAFSLLVLVFNHVGVFAGEAAAGRPEPIVEFGLAWTFALLVHQVYNTMHHAQLPRLAAADPEARRRFVVAQARFTALTLGGATAAAYWAGPWLVRLAFGGRHGGLPEPLWISLLAVTLWTLTNVPLSARLAEGRTAEPIRTLCVMLAAGLGLAPFAYARWGLDALPWLHVAAAAAGFVYAYRAFLRAEPAPRLASVDI